MKRSTVFTILTLVILIPATLFIGTKLSGRWYYLTSTLMIVEAMLPFFFAFETRRPQARELVMIAVMAALASVSRMAFSFIPHFKPITAIIMITGIAFGAESGFLTGAISAFASNFAFGQGPWTPWQMLAYGIGGFIAGVIFSRRKPVKKPIIEVIKYAVFGFFAILLVVGPLLDCSTIFTTGSKLSWSFVGAVFVAGLPANIMHCISCAITMALIGRPLLDKLNRVKIKYGMMETKTS